MKPTEYRYQLETPRVTGRRQQKTSCPQCGRRKCFVRYVDTRDGCRYLADHVGKCDHEHSCGYHFKPADYFREVPSVAVVQQQTKPPLPSPQPRGNNCQLSIVNCQLPQAFSPLSPAYVRRSHSPRSTFWMWFATLGAERFGIAPEAVRRVYEDYRIGATRYGCVIFWQIDRHEQVHGGHIMQYRPDGHRQGYQGWTHGPLIQQGLLPPDWQLHQCLFGEHLLAQQPSAHVCIVESEKTALILSALQPQHVWLATCGSGGLNPDKLECLRGRRFTLFPDSGCLQKWQRKMQETQGLDYNFCTALEQYPANTDLADLI